MAFPCGKAVVTVTQTQAGHVLSRINQAEEHRRIGRVYSDSIRTDRAAAGWAPVGVNACTVGLSLNTVAGVSGAVPRQRQNRAASGQGKGWGTQDGTGNGDGSARKRIINPA